MGGETVRGIRPTLGRLGVAGVVLTIVGGALFGTAVAASAPTITFKQSAPLGPGQGALVKVTGSGFAANSIGAFFECSTVSGQPTIDVTVFSGSKSADVGQVPVGCSLPQTAVTTATGTMPTGTKIGIGVGKLGPPASGVDSAGNQASNDAAQYPCPPSASQGSSATCDLVYIDGAGDTAKAPIQFSFQTTTTTTAPTTSTTVASCTPKSNSVTAVNPKTNTSATVTVDPATCLVSGQTVTVTAQGLQGQSIGSLLECNASGSNAVYSGTAGATVSSIVSGSLATGGLVGTPDKSGSLTLAASGGNAQIAYTSVTVSGTNATFSGLTLTSGDGTWTVAAGAVVTEGQPTANFLNNAIPVSCTQVKTFTTNPDGTIATSDQQFTIQEGVTGPPCTTSGATACQGSTDSAGNPPAQDAANFPCPPTAAQTSAGVTCVIAVGDVAGDKVPVPISFNLGGTPIPTTTTTQPTTSGSLVSSQNTGASTGGGTGAATSSSGGTLAYTGPGSLMWILGLLGVLFVLAGISLLVLVDAPRRLLFATINKVGRIGKSHSARQ